MAVHCVAGLGRAWGPGLLAKGGEAVSHLSEGGLFLPFQLKEDL